MRLSYIPDSLGYMGLEDMLDTVKSLGVDAIELTTGNWSSAPHIDLQKIVTNAEERKNFREKFQSRNMDIVALNCSGNPLAYKKDMDVTLQTFELAEQLGIKKIIMMSGLPPGCKGDTTPVWITTSWPPMTQDILKYQWEEVAIPTWLKIVEQAKNHGIEQIAIENHGWQLVYNPETLLKLRKEVGPMIGMNLDPSHLFWMGGDPIQAARELGDALYHVHGKDARLEKGKVESNGVLDTKPIQEYKNRSWNYVAVGCGHDLLWWKEFFSVVRMTGYTGTVSLEMEDLTMDPLTGVKLSIKSLKESLGIL